MKSEKTGIDDLIDVKKKHMDTKEERGDRMNWEMVIDIYTLLILCIK